MNESMSYTTAWSQLFYSVYYYWKIFQNVCHRHHPQLPKKIPKQIKHFHLSKTDLQKWRKLYHIDDKTADIPFTSFSKNAAMPLVFFNFLNQYDLSLANVLHIKSSLWLNSETKSLKNDIDYQVKYIVDDIICVRTDRICFIAKARVYQDNIPVMELKNGFLLSQLANEEAHLFDQLEHNPKHQPETFCNLSKKPALLLQDPDAVRMDFFVPPGTGSKYGILSGDMNPLHTSRFLAHLTGAKDAFIQGLCVFNYVISQLSLAGFSYEKINITFCQKVYENQTLILLYKQGHFELVDNQDGLLAFGRLH